MSIPTLNMNALPPETATFYRQAMRALKAAGVPFLVGGAYALTPYTGVVRHTKDFDVFVKKDDVRRVLGVLGDAGFGTEMTFPHWLAKAYHGDDFVDVIFSSGNGVATVDDEWFEHAVPGEVLGERVLLSAPEEMIWSKSFVMERERYDGADVNHLIRSRGPGLAWRRLLLRFGRHWRVLLSHLVLYGFVYPGERDKVPAWVLRELTGRLLEEAEAPAAAGHVCGGTLLSREQYLSDLRQRGYGDARLGPGGTMTPAEVRQWTEAIGGDR
jgi:hypothetical protein